MPDVVQTRSRMVERVSTTLSDFAVSRAAIIPQFMRLTADSTTTTGKLANLLARDPALSATVLRVANSAYYGRLRNVTTLGDAITVLGFSMMRSLAVAASLNSLLRDRIDQKLVRTLWDHSLAVAIGGRLICRKLKLSISEQAFLACLMHDLAKLILLLRFPSEYEPVLEEARRGFSVERDLEQQFLGVTHDQLGATILRQWNFPLELTEAVRLHHDPESVIPTRMQSETTENERRMAHIISLADALAHSRGYGIRNAACTDLTAHPSADRFELAPDALIQISEDLVRHVAEERGLYGS